MALKISFKLQRKQTKMHSYAMAGKHISQLTLLTNFINRSHNYLLPVLPVCMLEFFNFDFTTIIYLFFFFCLFLCAIVLF